MGFGGVINGRCPEEEKTLFCALFAVLTPSKRDDTFESNVKFITDAISFSIQHISVCTVLRRKNQNLYLSNAIELAVRRREL